MRQLLAKFLSVFKRTQKETIDVRDLIDPAGSSIYVSSNPEKRPRPPRSDFFGVKKAARARKQFKCGHQGPKWFQVSTYGMQTSKISEDNKCPECFLEEIRSHSCRCALCGILIKPGDAVALYHKRSKGLDLKIATFVVDYAIGCTYMDCCPSGGFFAGYWTWDGFKPAFQNGLCVNEEVMKTGKPIAVDIK